MAKRKKIAKEQTTIYKTYTQN